MSTLALDLSTPNAYGIDKYLARTSVTSLLKDTNTTKVIVAMGDAAFQRHFSGTSLTVDQAHSYCLPKADGTIVVPTYDPKDVFRSPDYEHWIDWALRKAKRLCDGTRTLDAPLMLRINPTLQEVLALPNELAKASLLAVDIECIPETCELTSIAFATAKQSICIPFAAQYLQPYWSEAEELQVWQAVQNVLASATPKVFHNFIFDVQVLRYAGITVNGAIHDTMVRASELNPLLPKSLKDVARLYLYCEPWKDQKDFKLTGDADAFYRYNAIDAARTLSIWGFQEQELSANALRDHYSAYVAPLVPLVKDVCEQGIRVDVKALSTADNQAEALLAPLEQELREIANPLMPPAYTTRKRNKEKDIYGPSPKTGKQIIITKGYDETRDSYNPRSSEQTKVILETLGYKLPTKRGRVSADRESLLKLNRRKPHPFISALLRHSKIAKLRSSYTSIVLDQDLRCRFSLNIAGTISGRFSAQKTPWETGLNIQTLPRRNAEVPIDIRGVFLPDEGHTLLEVDLSQAELRVVAWLSGETKLMELFAANQDVHAYTAQRITELSGVDCPRQLGKRINHASNYGMQAARFADSCLLEADLSIGVDTATKLLDARSRTFPAIPLWHQAIRAELYRTRRLESPQGRVAKFYGPVTDEMHRQALSFIPQATVVDTVNAVWISLAKLPEYNNDFRVLSQIHDSLVFSVKRDRLDHVIDLVKEAFDSQYVTIRGVRYKIPFDGKVGDTWSTLEKLF